MTTLSITIKCDRCGEINVNNDNFNDKFWGHYVYLPIDKGSDGSRQNKLIDHLCPNCCDKLKKFIEEA